MSKSAIIKWKPFIEKQKQYVHDALKCKMSVLEGAVRTGKTILNCIVAAIYLETCPDKIHLASGSTIPNAKLNIGDCNGFGLEYLFRGRCRWGKYKDNEALYLYTQTGEKIVLFAGGGKADSYKKILGNSYGLWIATEINEHYDSDDSRISFIKVAFNRQIAAEHPKVLWDLNPSKPDATIYTEYIDKYLTDYVGGYNYCHLSLAEVTHITNERKQEIISQYVKGSVWYRRDILGERCIAEGLCYEYMANHMQNYYCDKKYFINRLLLITIGVDFGGNQSATTFVAVGLLRGMREIVVLKAKRIKKALTPVELERMFNTFCVELYDTYQMPLKARCDNEETVLINGMKISSARNFGRCQIMNAKKTAIKGRIAALNKLAAVHKVWLYKDGDGVDEVAKAISRCTFDDNENRLDVVSFENPIDIMDAFEYGFEEFINPLITLSSL